MIKVSAVLSIHNRSRLLRRALDGYLWQTLPPEEWELVLVDDMSQEDLSLAYGHLVGKINITHVRMDHTKHRVFSELNPRWSAGFPKRWYHTPAISTNIGCAAARGAVLCLCHPEILHAPNNFARAYDRLQTRKGFLFGKTHLGTQPHNAWLENTSWTSLGGWDGFLRKAHAVDRLGSLGDPGFYWYTSFLARDAMLRVRGVDFSYLRGVAFEDDDLRERLRAAGWPPFADDGIAGFHQDHSDEKEVHRQRDVRSWHDGMERNRQTFLRKWKEQSFAQIPNGQRDWMAPECVVTRTDHPLEIDHPAVQGSVVP